MNEYIYIDTGGKQQKVMAANSQDATRLAPNIARNSGVMLSTPPKQSTNAPTPAANLNPKTAPELPAPKASSIQAEYMTSATEMADKRRAALDTRLKNDKSDADKEIVRLEKESKRILEKDVKPLTDPFREDLETKERERLYVNKNFEANQKLTDELDTLLTEGNNLIRYNQGLPVSQKIVGARSERAIQDVAARAGVIEAVMSARNNQIGQAYSMIDRSVAAITADRTDQLSYYETILNLNETKTLRLDTESKRIAQEQVNLMKGDLQRAEKTADYIKELMISPEHAQLIADSGVTLNDTIPDINKKIAEASKRQQVIDFSNEMALEGYKPTVAGTPGAKAYDVGGQKVYFTDPPVKATSSSSGGDGVVVRSGALTYTRGDYAEDASALESSRGGDGWVDPTIYLNLYNAWISNGGIINDFISKFPPKNYINPANNWLPPVLRNSSGGNSSDARLEALLGE